MIWLCLAGLFFLLVFTFLAGSMYGRIQEEKFWCNFMGPLLDEFPDVKDAHLVTFELRQIITRKE